MRPDNWIVVLIAAVAAITPVRPVVAQQADAPTTQPIVVSAACDRTAADPRGCAAQAVAAELARLHPVGIDLKWSSNRSAFESTHGPRTTIPALVQYQEYPTRVVAVAVIERRDVPQADALDAGAREGLPSRSGSASGRAIGAPVDAVSPATWFADSGSASRGAPMGGVARRAQARPNAGRRDRSPAAPPYTVAGPDTLRLVVARRKPVTVTFWPAPLDPGAPFRADTAVAAGRCVAKQTGVGVVGYRIDANGLLLCTLRLDDDDYSPKAALAIVARMKVSGQLVERTVPVAPVVAPTYTVVGEGSCGHLAKRAMAILADRGLPTTAPKRAVRRMVLTRCAKFDQILPTQTGDVPENGLLVEGRADEANAQSPLGSRDIERVGMFQFTVTPPNGTDPWQRAAESVVAKLLRYEPL